MKQRLLLFCVFCMITATSAWAQTATAPSLGSGTKSDPYQIATLDHLYWLSQNSNKWDSSFVQTTNIDAEETANWNDGSGFSPIGNYSTRFTGKYNGQGYTINGLTINRSSTNYVGLFGYTNKASIDSLGLMNINIQGYEYVGGLVGNNNNSTISTCYATGLISGDQYIGGLVGQNNYTIVNTCYTTASVYGRAQIGGLIGDNRHSTVSACYTTGVVSGELYVGGFVGVNNSSTINACYYNSEMNNQIADIGQNYNSQTVNALNTAQMKQSSNFSSWDFENNWDITEGVSFPRLIAIADAPIILQTFTSLTQINENHKDTIQAISMDNPILTITLLQFPEGMSLTQDSIISWTPTEAGTYTVEISVSDADGLQSIYQYSITVISLNGEGTSHNPYKITSLADLRQLSETSVLWDGTYFFEQTTNIDASATANWNNGNGFSPIGNDTTQFTGTYNGQGYSIDSLIINQPLINYVGLFGYTKSANIDSLGLINANIQGNSKVGGLVGMNSSSTVSACYATGTVSGNDEFVGGLVGRNHYSSVSTCYTAVTVSGNNETGGLVGNNTASTINACYATGVVSGNNYLGGLVGNNDYSCTISACYAIGAINGSDEYIGGLAGYNNSSSTIDSSYYNSETNSQITGIGKGYNNQIVNALSTAQMKQSSSFKTWDFEHNWEINEGASFPRLVAIADAPIILHTFTSVGQVSEAYSDTISIITMDNLEVSLKLLQAPEGMSLIQDSIINWTPTKWGNYEVEISASDANELQSIYQYTITVIGLSGQGTSNNPYKITSLEDLKQLSETSKLWDGAYYFEQTTNIDASETATWNSGYGFSPIGNETTPFTGNYKGQGFTINGITINRPSSNQIGLFGNTEDANIDSLGLTQVNIVGESYVGGLIGESRSSTINTCYVTGLVSGYYDNTTPTYDLEQAFLKSTIPTESMKIEYSYIGGLIGYNSSSTVNTCYTTSSVSGYSTVGGLVGYNTSSTISASYSTGSISENGDVSKNLLSSLPTTKATSIITESSFESSNLGGLIGYNNSTSTVRTCYATGTVSGNSNLGGLIGYNNSSSTVRTCYATGTVSGNSNLGGLVGRNRNSTINTCYATGLISCTTDESDYFREDEKVVLKAIPSYLDIQFSSIGGLIGYSSSSTVDSSYYNSETSGQTSGIGSDYDDQTVSALSTAQMQQSSSFNEWNFNNDWSIVENSTYPTLQAVSNNAPFAFADTLEVGISIELSTPLLANDYDYETAQETLTYKVMSTTAGSVSNGRYAFNSDANNGDSDTLTYRVGEILANNDTLWGNEAIVVLSKNNIAPELSISDTIMNENTSIKLDLSGIEASDTNKDILSLVIMSNDNYTVNSDTITPDPGYYGKLKVPVYVSDGELNSDTLNLNITVNAVPDSTVLIWDTPESAVYGDFIGSDAMNAETTSIGTISYNFTTDSLFDAGSHQLIAEFTPDDKNKHTNAIAKVEYTVNKARLNATVDSIFINESDEIPTFSISYSGFVNDESESELDTAPKAMTIATTESEAGKYSITVSGGVDNNYDFTYKEGILTIKEALAVKERSAEMKVSVYPNPANSIIEIDLPDGMTSATIELYNATGSKLMEQQATSNNTELNIAHLPQGIYVFKITSNAQSTTISWIKK